MTNLKTQLPSLNANELKMLARIIADEVIGEVWPSIARFNMTDEVEYQAECKLRKFQRQRLEELCK